MAPIPAIAKNMKPVTSSQSWCSTWPKERAVARIAASTALPVRLRSANWVATRKASLIFLTVWPSVKLVGIGRSPSVDFSSGRGYNGAGRHRSYCHACRQRRPIPGGLVDQQLKQLMKELGEAINGSLSDSEQIAEVVSRIKEGGYDIFLVLEATIGVSKQGEHAADKTSLVSTLSTNSELKISDQDLKFLKSLRIKIEDEIDE
jgi:hypothetical protein